MRNAQQIMFRIEVLRSEIISEKISVKKTLENLHEKKILEWVLNFSEKDKLEQQREILESLSGKEKLELIEFMKNRKFMGETK